MRPNTPALSATAQAASSRAAATQRVRVCHYGTGASPNSPVVVTLPSTLAAPRPVVMAAAVADEVRWLYENDFSAAAQLTRYFAAAHAHLYHGRFERADEVISGARSHWRSITPMPDFADGYEGLDGPEDLHLDCVGRIAAYAETYPGAEAYRSTDSLFAASWGSDVKVPSRRLAVRRAAGMLATAAGIVGLAVAGDMWEFALVAPFTVLGYARRFPYVRVAPLSIAKWAAYEALPDPTQDGLDKAEKAHREKVRQGFAEAIVNLDDTETFDLANRLLRDETVRRWNAWLREDVEKEVGVLEHTPEPQSLLARALADDAGTVADAPDYDLLTASRALLDEFEARRTNA